MDNFLKVTMRNPYQIYNFEQNVDSSKLYGKILERKNPTKIRKPKIKEKLGRR